MNVPRAVLSAVSRAAPLAPPLPHGGGARNWRSAPGGGHQAPDHAPHLVRPAVETGLRLACRFAAVVALIAAISLPGSAQAGDIQGDGGKVRLLYNEPGTNSFPPFVIKKFALDKKYGFELVPIAVGTPQAGVNAMQSGGADVGLFDWITMARVQNAGVKLIGIAPFLIWANTVIVPANSPAKTLADLKGKKVGIYSRNNLDWVVMRTYTHRRFNFDLEKEATVHEGAVPLLRGLADQGQLDAVQMFNSLTPDMVASGKYRVLATIRGLIKELGMPDTPFLMYAVDSKFATAYPARVKAFLAAYREALDILGKDDAVWVERGTIMKLQGQALTLFRDEAREDMMGKFEPQTEADIRKVFAVLLETGGAQLLGIDALPKEFMTLAYQ
ncbi:MAG TPA: ABC transporter substrate-binding protein [Xanthobacteraceae bacterium]|nr:ABC transporter substrate-binding protein [Xanthobacteraceae bacterium]